MLVEAKESEKEQVKTKEEQIHEWDFIVASWPPEVQEADRLLCQLEQEMDDMVEVAIQHTISRCKRYSQEKGYAYNTFQLNKGLVFFNRTVEEMTVRDTPTLERSDLREALTDKFISYLDEMFNTMRTHTQLEKIKSGQSGDRFPGDIVSMALIHQAIRLLSKHLAAQKEMKRLDYLSQTSGSLYELLNKHVTLLDMGKEIL